MHAVDWFPTILEATSTSYSDPQQDGMSQWQAINSRAPAKREEIIYNLDYHPLPVQGRAAIRVGDYKLIDGFPGLFRDWVKPDTVEEREPFMDYFDSSHYVSFDELGPVLPNITVFKYLFNLKEDPTEHNNLYGKLPEVVKKLEDRLAEVKAKNYVPPNWPAGDPNSNPNNYGGAWTPGWC